jgi:hypothetical protein
MEAKASLHKNYTTSHLQSTVSRESLWRAPASISSLEVIFEWAGLRYQGTGRGLPMHEPTGAAALQLKRMKRLSVCHTVGFIYVYAVYLERFRPSEELASSAAD